MEKIVVAIDPEIDPAGQPALEWAIARAQARPASLELLTVIPSAHGPRGNTLVQSAAPYADDVQRAADLARTRAPASPVSVSVRRGSPARVLMAVSWRADLLVIGSHPTGALAGILRGTIALQVAGRSECPVAVVPSGWEPGGPARVVVGWTDDATADEALEIAAQEAADADTTLTIVNSWGQPFGTDAVPEVVDVLRDLVEAAARRVRASHPALLVEVAFGPTPAVVALVERARDAGLLVVGSHGRGALGSLILGSTSHDVLVNMPSPVLVVPPPGERVTVLPEIPPEDVP